MTAAATDLQVRPVTAITAQRTIEDIVEQKRLIQECIGQVMKEGEHYGIIPGTSRMKDGKEQAKPSLLKPGAETLGFLFRLKPSFKILSSVETPEFIKYKIRCTLRHIDTDKAWGQGLGSCNSRETKYVRPAPKTCPKCKGAFLIVGNPEYEREAAFKGGMLCYPKKGGCGAKYKPGDEAIEKQPTGIADPSDLDNTILKMACKRAHVAATLAATAASDFFTQDLEDLAEKAAEYTPPAAAPQQPAPTRAAQPAARTLKIELEPPPGPSDAPPPNVPAQRKDGPGAWPKAVGERKADVGNRELDDQYRRTMDAPVQSDLVAQLQRSIDENTIEVTDNKTGEVTRHTKATKAQSKKIHAMVRDLDISDESYRQGLKKYYFVDSSDLLTKAQAADMIERLTKTAERARGVNDKYDAAADAAQVPVEDRGDEPTPEEMENAR